MDISNIFQMVHGAINTEEQLEKINDKEMIDCIVNNGCDPSYFYENKNNFINPYCYFDKSNYLYIPISIINQESFDLFKYTTTIRKLNDCYNDLYEKNDYLSLIGLIDKILRIEYLNKFYKDFPKNDLEDIFKYIYSSSEYGFEKININTLEYIKCQLNEFSDNDEYIEIYRGQGDKSLPHNIALSWTTNIKVAKFFADRFNSNGNILKGKILKKDIITFIDDREENEVVVMPNKVFNVKAI